jgi:hypothetical protein
MESPTPNVPDLEALWDYHHPVESERRFHEVLQTAPPANPIAPHRFSGQKLSQSVWPVANESARVKRLNNLS